MDRVATRRLRPWEGMVLRQMKWHLSNTVNSWHARNMLLSRGEVRNRYIAQRFGCTSQWVLRIIHRCIAPGSGRIAAITWYPYYCGRGEPYKFFAEVVAQIAEVARWPRQKLNGMSGCSLAKLPDYLAA